MRSTMLFVLFMFFSAGILFAVSHYTDNGNETVTDSNTGLIWQQCSKGLSGASCATGTATTDTWANAITYCEGLTLGSRSDWRLPSINEITSLMDYGKSNPAIDSVFANTPSDMFWTSTTANFNTANAYYALFNYGLAHGADPTNSPKTASHYIRCVTGP